MQFKPSLLIFDVNETLLDMTPLKESINSALKVDHAFESWFPTLLHYSLVETITENYKDFSKIASATLKMIASKNGVTLKDSEAEKILQPISKLKAHPEVRDALSNLKKEGFKMVALTNGKPDVALAQVQYAEIDEFFDKVISVEELKKYKPHPDAYLYACHSMNIIKENAILIAAHGWDITGAHRAGLQTAFIEREGKFTYPLANDPDITGKDLSAIAKVLLSS